MAEGVVVALEAVEVEDHERASARGAGAARRRSRSVSSLRRLPSPVSASVVASCAGQLEEPPVLPERQREPDDDGEQRRGGEHDGDHAQADEVVVDEDPDRDRAQTAGTASSGWPSTSAPRSRCAPTQPMRSGAATRARGCRSRCPRRTYRRRSGRGRGRRRRPWTAHPARGAASAPRSPARQREGAEDGGEEQHVAKRVGEVREHRRGRALGRHEHELEEDRRRESAGGQRRGDAVEPERPADDRVRDRISATMPR